MDIGKLIIKCQSGDTAAFGELYELFSEKIFRFIKLKVQSQQPAEDILQETFVKAWKALPNFKVEGGNFSAWLYKIAGNSVNDYFRKLYRSPETLELNEQIDIADPISFQEQSDLQADVQNIKTVLSDLPVYYRQVLELRFIQDFSINETAQILGKSNLAIRLSQHRALKELRKIINSKQNDEFAKI
jgi:RNA polymerase sigma-70 factor, ECF subfamily